ncbi:MAG: hypothetical protein GXP26_00365 [Planctomycetes bacterium]|nr:hypothetical protein [Planctomycetota bacterium]
MNALTELLTLWLADYFLLATLLLTVALVLFRLINQPARRLVLARPTLAALFLLSGLCAMPGWSLVHLMTEEKPTTSLLELSDIQIAAPITPPTTQLIPTIDIDRLPQTPPIQTQSTIEASPTPPSEPFPWPVWLSSIYLGGCLLFIVWQASGSILARRLLRHATPAPPQVQSLLVEIGEDAKRLPNLLVSNDIQAPAALGVFQPTILLPQAMLSDQSDSLRPILAHELAHIRHGDLRTLAAARLLTILLWPQPLYWLLRRQVRLDQETLADAAAADVTNRTDYAEQLVAWARNATDTPAPRLASSVGLWESPSQLKHRVAMLLDEKLTILRTCTRRWRYLCTAFVATAAVGLSLITLQPSTVASGKPDNGSTIAKLSEEQQVQVRLAIETLSKPGLVDPVEEWGPAVQTLVEIGPPAVPSLIEALDEEVLDHPIRKIAFTLRAINDKRAIPALIRAIPRTLQPPASDYGLEVKDNDLSKFLRQYDTVDGSKFLTYGRAFREVVLTLQKMTDGVSHSEMELNFVHKQGTPSQQTLQKKLFEKAATRWARWWEENWEDYVADSHYAKVGLPSLASPSRQSQIADKSVHFPVGDDVRLSEGTSGVTISPAENPRRDCFYDLDTGRQAGWPSELPAWGTVDENSPKVIEWARKEGFDLLGVLENENDSEIKKYAVRMLGMRAWQITDTQFKELPKAMQGEVPYPLNKKVQRMEVLRDPGMSGPYRNFEGNPYLFLTREGNHGVLKLSEPGSFPYPSVKAEIKFFIQSNDASKPRKAEWQKEIGTPTFTVDLTEATPPASSQEEKPSANGTLVLSTPPADSDEERPGGTLDLVASSPVADTDDSSTTETETETAAGATALSDKGKGKLLRPLHKQLHDATKPNMIHGLCIDENSQPLAGVLVKVFSRRVRGPEQNAKPILTTKSDKQGKFRFVDVIDIEREFPEGIPEEHFQPQNTKVFIITGQADGRVPGFEADVAPTIARQGDSLLWMMQPAQTLRGRITDEQGQPVAGAQVSTGYAGIWGGNYGINQATTNANGEYVIADLAVYNAVEAKRKMAEAMKADPNIAMTRYSYADPQKSLLVKHPKFAAKRATIKDIPSKVDLQLVPGSVIEGRVAFPTDNTATKFPAGSIVRLERVLPQPKTGEQPIPPRSFQTESIPLDETGHYRFESLPAGKYHLTADVEGWVTQGVENVEVARGKTATAPDILLMSGGRVRVQLVDDKTGKPLHFEKPTKGYINPQQRSRRPVIFYFRNNIVEFTTDGVGEIQIPAGRYAFPVSIPDKENGRLTSILTNDIDDLATYEIDDGELLEISVRMRLQEPTGFTGTIRRASPANDESTDDKKPKPKVIFTPATPPAEEPGTK